MILGYKSPPGEDAYWFSDEKRFKRVVASLCFPYADRISGCAIVLGEMFRAAGPQDLTGLAALVGTSPEVENALIQYRRDLKFDHLITEKDEERAMLFRIPGLTYGLEEIPLITYPAPPWAVGEIGRQKVNQMIAEGRLHLDPITAVLDAEPEQALRCLECAVVWMQENRAIYAKPREKAPKYRRVWGTTGL